MRPRRLQLGEVVRYEGALWRVDLVNACRARLAPLSTKRVRIHDSRTGADREFDGAVGRAVSISPEAVIERVTPAELEDLVATKKAAKKATKAEKTEKAPRAPKAPRGVVCTFAIRITPEQAFLIHKAAGPGKATKWATAVLVAAASGDMAALKDALVQRANAQA